MFIINNPLILVFSCYCVCIFLNVCLCCCCDCCFLLFSFFNRGVLSTPTFWVYNNVLYFFFGTIGISSSFGCSQTALSLSFFFCKNSIRTFFALFPLSLLASSYSSSSTCFYLVLPRHLSLSYLQPRPVQLVPHLVFHLQ